MDSPIFAHVFSYKPAAVIRVFGEDALAFLQGQFTQELRFPVGPLCAYGLWLNQKGKVVADSFALREGDAWWLVSIQSPAEIIKDRLETYIIADDVTLEDQTAEWTAKTIVGPYVFEGLQEEGLVLPGTGQWVRAGGGLLFRGRRDAGETWEWLGPEAAAEGIGAELPAIAEEELERRRILAGIPTVPKDVGPGDLPNEAGLEEIAISYSKGCYLGQEVMARLKSMGQVRRKLLRVRGVGSPPTLPAPLFLGAKKIGELRSTAVDEAGNGFVGLAMISLTGLDLDQPFSTVPQEEATVRVMRGLS